MGQRMSWAEICNSKMLRGQWVALNACRYDQRNTSHPTEGEIVDADEDLSELCRRVQEASRTHCAIVFCDEEAPISGVRGVTRPNTPSLTHRSPR